MKSNKNSIKKTALAHVSIAHSEVLLPVCYCELQQHKCFFSTKIPENTDYCTLLLKASIENILINFNKYIGSFF